jgi:hypothetical protein
MQEDLSDIEENTRKNAQIYPQRTEKECMMQSGEHDLTFLMDGNDDLTFLSSPRRLANRSTGGGKKRSPGDSPGSLSGILGGSLVYGASRLPG